MALLMMRYIGTQAVFTATQYTRRAATLGAVAATPPQKIAACAVPRFPARGAADALRNARFRRESTGAAMRPASSFTENVLKRAREAASRVSSVSSSTLAKFSPAEARRALSLRIQAFYKANAVPLSLGAAALVAYGLWRSMHYTASAFISLSETFAEIGVFAAAISVTATGLLYLRHRHTLDPTSVYTLAMRQLNNDPRVLELLGAPLTGTELRAFVMSGGHLRVRSNFLPKISSRRCHLIFPLQGSAMRGIVSAEAKKKNGSYIFKLLCVDVPTSSSSSSSPPPGAAAAGAGGGGGGGGAHTRLNHDGRQQFRIFVQGSQADYERSKIIAELRDPFIEAAEMQNEYDAEDDSEDYEEAMRRQQHIVESRPRPMSDGGGMFSYERIIERTRSAATGVFVRVRSAFSARSS